MKKSLEAWMNDPDIINEPMPLREIHAIRLMIADEMRDMTPAQRTALVKKRTDAAMEQYGLTHLAVESARQVH